MGLPVISYIDLATAATGWLAIAAVSIFGLIASLIAVIAGCRTFSRFLTFR